MGRHGENIRKRKDGRWEARIIVGYDLNGKAKYHSIYGKTYAETKEKRNELLRNADKLLTITPKKNSQKITVTELTEEWLRSKQDAVKESTYAHYSRIVRKHILPELGSLYVSSLTTDLLNDFLKQKLHSGNLKTKEGMSAKSVADIRSILIQNIEFARQNKYICPVEGRLFFPHAEPNRIEVLSLAEQSQLETVLFSNMKPFHLGILVTLYGGLRIGEICALQWKDIHLNSRTIHITKTLLRIENTTRFSSTKTRLILTQPKTLTSHRSIPLPSFLIDILKEYRESPDDYLLTGTSFPLEPRACLAKYKRLLRQAGLRPYTFHALRHTFATRCVGNGFDAKSLSEILGHSNVNTTLQRYVHPSMELKREQMERLERLVR